MQVFYNGLEFRAICLIKSKSKIMTPIDPLNQLLRTILFGAGFLGNSYRQQSKVMLEL